MKKIIALSLWTLFASVLLSCNNPSKNGNFKHVVAFKFKPEVSQNQIITVLREFANLKNEIPAIVNFEGGKDVSNENLHQGFTHCFTVSFENEAGRAVYQPHPAHQKFGKNITPLLEKVFVMDYVVE